MWLRIGKGGGGALVNTAMKQPVPKDCGRRSYILRHCDLTSSFILVYNLLCCLRQNHILMVFKQGTETKVCYSEANKPSTFNGS
jgi:hypothetical protein